MLKLMKFAPLHSLLLKGLFLTAAWAGFVCQAGAQPSQVLKQKTVDGGGSGPYKTIAVQESGLPDFVVYRPNNLAQASANEGPLPIVVFGNGGCSDTSLGYERMLTEVASHGYVVVAIGELMMAWGDRQEGHSASTELKRGLDWLVQQCHTEGSAYCGTVDAGRVAAAGHSCGGAQVLANAADERIATCLILNAGMGDMTMADASRESLKGLHGPVLYVTGGPSDVAYENAKLDYARIDHVPVAWADHPASGHGGTYGQEFGGDYSRMVLAWLDWQLKGKTEHSCVFVHQALDAFKGWTLQSKNWSCHRPGKFVSATMPCKLLNGVKERRYGIYLPGSYDEAIDNRKYPVLYLLHGGGGAHTDWEQWNHLSAVADSLIACHAMKDMIVVCAEGNDQHMMYFNASPSTPGAPDWRYEDYFFEELIPFIEGHYRVRTDKGGRAIAGFSMGGGAATVYGVHRPELFSMVYDISGYQRAQPLEFLKNDPSAAWRQQVIDDNNPIVRVEKGSAAEVKAWQQVDWKIAVGDHDFTLEANLDLFRALRTQGVPCALHVDAGEHNALWVNPALLDALLRADRNFKADPVAF